MGIISDIIIKVVGIILIMLFMIFISNLYKVFDKISNKNLLEPKDDACWVSIGIISEVILLVIIIIKMVL